MKKKLKNLFVLICLFPLLALSKQIPVNDALKVAQTLKSGGNLARTSVQLNLVTTVKGNSLLRSNQQSPNLYYIFNVGNNNGYVIVAADDVCTPVIAYTTNGSYDETNLPPNYMAWMEDVQKGIQEAIVNNTEPTDDVKAQWLAYLNGNTRSMRSTNSVAPLIQTKWDQAAPYWNSIPERNSQSIPAKTGCVATAMAQIMKYHKHPTKLRKTIPAYTTSSLQSTIPAIDMNKYTHAYSWSHMDNIYGPNGNSTVSNMAVADLMFHCGASVQTAYDFRTSYAYSSDVRSAFYEYLGYNSSFLTRRQFYSDAVWKSMMKDNLNKKLPIYYDSRTVNNDDGHAFICDGYDSNELFHFNWGWGGNQDGFYSLVAVRKFNQ